MQMSFLKLVIFVFLFIGKTIPTESHEAEPELVLVPSTMDGKEYAVANYSDKSEAANYLAEIRKGFDHLSLRLQKLAPSDARVKKLASRYSPQTTIQENIRNGTSFSRNKGEMIALCLRSPTNLLLEKLNSIKFVAFHELAHVITDSIDHTPEFYSNFRYLLSHAIKWRLYEEIDYRRKPTSYCGTILNYSPPGLHNDRKMRSYL